MQTAHSTKSYFWLKNVNSGRPKLTGVNPVQQFDFSQFLLFCCTGIVEERIFLRCQAWSSSRAVCAIPSLASGKACGLLMRIRCGEYYGGQCWIFVWIKSQNLGHETFPSQFREDPVASMELDADILPPNTDQNVPAPPRIQYHIPPPHQVVPVPVGVPRIPVVSVPIPSAISTQSHCFVCKSPVRTRIKKRAIIEVFIRRGILIPENNRCCREHLNGEILNEDVITSIVIAKDSSSLTGEQVSKWMMTLRGIITEKTSHRLLQEFSPYKF
ncbi:hypothetical protein Fcan01_13643 [Folsomia candida]|uniref:Uncharacterized protein n=1 Tax=Folsomia candida TaxID=158441 RepID=A0A226E3B6_FOLCA|nr:hypothetical protein Fcan01_13643 [Folsomia candida]